MVRLEIFVSPNCQNCDHTVQILQRLAVEFDDDHYQWRKVDVVDEIDYAVGLGVLATPSIAINGILIFTAAPSEKSLRLVVAQHMKGNRCI